MEQNKSASMQSRIKTHFRDSLYTFNFHMEMFETQVPHFFASGLQACKENPGDEAGPVNKLSTERMNQRRFIWFALK
ncbi:MAG: hypothetical protein HYZ65_08100 [Burkholderiales bacterium]|nr:hypothetical protein [Burkholderiales bacterium]